MENVYSIVLIGLSIVIIYFNYKNYQLVKQIEKKKEKNLL